MRCRSPPVRYAQPARAAPEQAATAAPAARREGDAAGRDGRGGDMTCPGRRRRRVPPPPLPILPPYSPALVVVATVRCPLSGSLSGGPGAAGPGTGLGPEPRMQQQPVRARRASEIKFALGLLSMCRGQDRFARKVNTVCSR